MSSLSPQKRTGTLVLTYGNCVILIGLLVELNVIQKLNVFKKVSSICFPAIQLDRNNDAQSTNCES